jgi:hypothetical protein
VKKSNRSPESGSDHGQFSPAGLQLGITTEERINMMFDLVNEERGFRNEGWENYRNMLLNTYPKRDAETNYQHAARQAYIGLGTALIAAAEEQVDSTPMEGFIRMQ